MIALESTKEGMFKNENPISENKQIELGQKNQKSMLRTSSKKKEEKKKKWKERKKKRFELYHVRRYIWSNLM